MYTTNPAARIVEVDGVEYEQYDVDAIRKARPDAAAHWFAGLEGGDTGSEGECCDDR